MRARGFLALLILALAAISLGTAQTAGAQTNGTVPNMVGTWNGTMNDVAFGGGYNQDVPVTMTITDQRELGRGSVFFRGTITVAKPVNLLNKPVTGHLEGMIGQLTLDNACFGCHFVDMGGTPPQFVLDCQASIFQPETIKGPMTADVMMTKQ